MLRIIFLVFLTGFLTPPPAPLRDGGSEEAIRQAVSELMETYPESTLKDLYKSFFQDRFGPGHLIDDPGAAGRYLQQELDSYAVGSGPLIEPTGSEHHYYRVNLSLVKEGIISPETLLDALIRSANEAEPVPLSAWQKEWSRIEAVIRQMYPDLPAFETDSAGIREKLEEGRYIGHHSDAYNKAYAPHYRIISRKIAEEELLPLLK